jgi:methionine synthase II (cobalamin-independent)
VKDNSGHGLELRRHRDRLPAAQGPQKALELVTASMSEVPYWPQLPALGFGENMYAQFSYTLPGAKVDPHRKRITVDLNDYDPEEFYTAVVTDDVDHFAHQRDHFQGLYALLDKYEGRKLPAVKGQVTGPVSAGLQVLDQDGKAAIYDEAYGEIIRRNLNMQAKWQARKLGEISDRPVLFLDEPSLTLIGTPFASISQRQVVEWTDEVLEGVDAIKGMHCCGNTDWALVLGTHTDILSFDTYNYGASLSAYTDSVKNLIDRGGAIAWGIVPNTDSTLATESVAALKDRLEEAMAPFSRHGVPFSRLKEQSLLTPSCSLAALSEEGAEQALQTLVSLSARMRGQTAP